MPADRALEMLRPVELPGLIKCVLTDAKFDAQKAAKTFNVEANYDAEPVQLWTLAAWSGSDARSAEPYLDALELFALRAIIKRDGPFDYIILQRHVSNWAEGWSSLQKEVNDKLYLDLGDGSLLLNLRAPGGSLFLEIWWELHLTGAVYGFKDYSRAAALAAAAHALGLSGWREGQ